MPLNHGSLGIQILIVWNKDRARGLKQSHSKTHSTVTSEPIEHAGPAKQHVQEEII